jgi:quinolinate synthase
MAPRVVVDPKVAARARRAIDRMLAVSAGQVAAA